MDGLALIVGARGPAIARALEHLGARSVVVNDPIGAMAALGRGDFRALVVATPERSRALPLKTLSRVALARHAGIALLYVRRTELGDEGVEGAVVEAIPLDATDQEVAALTRAAMESFEPGQTARLVFNTVEETTRRDHEVVPTAPLGPLLEGTLGGGSGAAVLAGIFAQDLTGKLVVQDGPALYFAAGEPVAVDIDKPAAIPAPLDGDTHPGLHNTGLFSAAAFLKGHRERVRDRVLAVIVKEGGSYAFYEDNTFLDRMILSKVSTFGMILEARRRRTSPTSVMSEYHAIADKYLWPSIGLERATARLLPFTRDVDVATVITGATTTEAFLSAIGLDNLMGTLVVLTLADALLVTLNAAPLEIREQPLGDLPKAVANPFDVAEGNSAIVDDDDVARLYVQLKPINDAHVILGVEPDAGRDQIEAAYANRNHALRADGVPTSVVLLGRIEELRRKFDLARAQLLPTPQQATGRVGQYELVEAIGEGGMAEVFVGKQVGIQGFSKKVVVKRILRKHAADTEVVRMFLEEARIAARISHPNVVAIYDLGESGGEFYIVMEYVDGPDLAALLASAKKAGEKVPFEIAAHLVAEMCAGLHAAHTHVDDAGRPAPIIHRDVSPENVLVSSDGHVKLADFGVAKRADALNQTMPGLLKGKPAYLSPEYITEGRADARSDVFAAGLVLYVCLTAEHPFERATPYQSLYAVLSGGLPAVDDTRPDTPPALRAILSRALAHDPGDRFQSAHAFRLALLSFIKGHSDGVSEIHIAEWARSLRRAETRRITPRTADHTFDDVTLELKWPYGKR